MYVYENTYTYLNYVFPNAKITQKKKVKNSTGPILKGPPLAGMEAKIAGETCHKKRVLG